MPTIRIDSIEDPRVAVYRDLPGRNLTRHSGRFVAEGRLLVERLVASDYEVDSILVDIRREELVPAGLADPVPVYVAAPGLVEEIIGFNFHRGILACGRGTPDTVLADVMTGEVDPLTLVVCVGVRDPINLGGILRNCLAFGVDTVVLGPGCGDPFSRRVLRVSMGAVFKLALVTSDDLGGTLARLQGEYGVQLAAAVLSDAAGRLERATRPKRLALVFGNEGYGLDDDVLNLCHRHVTIPMCNDTDSLNAAVASGVFLYHFTRMAQQEK